MKALVIYDSVFGNTEKIARAIATELGADATLKKVSDASGLNLSGYTHVLVGSPTRQFRATPATTDFIAGLPADSLKGIKVAAFDTRLDTRFTTMGCAGLFVAKMGFAAEPISKALVKKGGTLAVAPEWFIVLESEGPLKEGELERAAEWARLVVSAGTL